MLGKLPIIRKIALLFAVAFLSAGCGIRIDAESANSQFSASVNLNGHTQAVWHDGNTVITFNAKTADAAQVYLEPALQSEDGNYYQNVLVTKPDVVEKDSTIYGIYQFDLLDSDKIKFEARIGFPKSDNPPQSQMIFKLSIQEGDEFPVLAELQAYYDGSLKNIDVDLTPYRGKSVFLILSVQAKEADPQFSGGIWVEPGLSYEYY